MYIKNTWTTTTAITAAMLNQCGTQYEEALAGASSHQHNDRYYTRSEMDSTFWHAGNDGAGSGCDADALYHPDGNMHFADFITSSIKAGTVIMWDRETIPTGWALCDGSPGTINLQGWFVLGAGGEYGVGAYGGSPTSSRTISLTVNTTPLTSSHLPAHKHTFDDYYPAEGAAGGAYAGYGSALVTTTSTTSETAAPTAEHGHPGSTVTVTASNLPPYVALRYIQKL